MGTRIECAHVRRVQTSAQSGLDNSYTSWLRGLLYSYNVLSKRTLTAKICFSEVKFTKLFNFTDSNKKL